MLLDAVRCKNSSKKGKKEIVNRACLAIMITPEKSVTGNQRQTIDPFNKNKKGKSLK